MKLEIDRFVSPIGVILLAHDGEGRLRALDFEDHEPRMLALLHRHYGQTACAPGAAPAATQAALSDYFAGRLGVLLDIPVATEGTAFQRAAWDALRAIPPGETRSYGQQAASMGKPKAARAVGRANGDNPIAIVTPCHRVIGASGDLTGFGGGLSRKAWLLSHEGALPGY
jgi:O-6-methylguanine DNA methyltransferase